MLQQLQTLLVELAQLYRELLYLALADALTGLPNYRAVISRLHEATAQDVGTPGTSYLQDIPEHTFILNSQV